MEFKIKDSTWEIIKMSNDELAESEYNNNRQLIHYGLCNTVKNKIYLNESLCKDREKWVLKHELTHAYLYEYAHSMTQDKTYTEEDVCGLFSLFADNLMKVFNAYYEHWDV